MVLGGGWIRSVAGGAGVAGPPRHAGVTRHLSSKENDSAVVGAGRSAGSGGSAPSRQTLQHLTSGTRRRKDTENHQKESSPRITGKSHPRKSPTLCSTKNNQQERPSPTTTIENDHHQKAIIGIQHPKGQFTQSLHTKTKAVVDNECEST